MTNTLGRFAGGSPAMVAVRLVVVSFVVGIILETLGFDPATLLSEAIRAAKEMVELGFRDNIPQQQVGANLRGRSVRALSEDDFAAIVAAGLSETRAPENAERLNLSLATGAQANADLRAPPGQDRERHVEQILTNRAIRDASFRGLVCDAYEGRCAVTWLRMLADRRTA
jgi:putative restriction endonuclease